MDEDRIVDRIITAISCIEADEKISLDGITIIREQSPLKPWIYRNTERAYNEDDMIIIEYRKEE